VIRLIKIEELDRLIEVGASIRDILLIVADTISNQPSELGRDQLLTEHGLLSVMYCISELPTTTCARILCYNENTVSMLPTSISNLLPVDQTRNIASILQQCRQIKTE